MKHKIRNTKQKGYSLIELVVVLAIFSVLAGVTVDIFISIVKNQKRILEEQELLDQTSYAMQYMSNALRAAAKDTSGSCLNAPGDIYELTHCPVSCTTPQPCPCNGIKFINSLDSNVCDEIFLDTSVSITNPPLRESKDYASPLNLLSSKLKLKYGSFVINGDKTLHVASFSDLVQPRVTMLLDVLTALNQSEKIFQTTVSQRNFNGFPTGGGCDPNTNLCPDGTPCVPGGGLPPTPSCSST